MFKTKKSFVFVGLSGILITSAVVAELIAIKTVKIGPFTTSVCILPWSFVFLTTDLINEHFGEKRIRKLSYATACLIIYTFVILHLSMLIPATKEISPVNDDQFYAIFGQDQHIIAGSIIAFLFSQLIDVSLFRFLKKVTGRQKLWLRATGSTAISQIFDTFIMLAIAYLLPGKIKFETFIALFLTSYVFKLVIAILLTPLIYLGNYMIKQHLAEEKR